jgi:cysteine-rich repeat protein
VFASVAFAQLGDVIGSNDLGQGKMRWALDTNTVVWAIPGGAFPNTVGFNGTDVFHVTGDNACNPLPVNRIDAATGAVLGSFTLQGSVNGLCTHLEDLAFSGPNDLWATDIFNNRLIQYDITTGNATQVLPITGSFLGGSAVFSPTGIASTPQGLYASMGFGSPVAGLPPEIGVIDSAGVYTPVFLETFAPYTNFYVHSLSYDSSRGVLWENLSFASPGSGTAQVLRQRFLNGTSAGPDIVLDPSPVSGRFDGFEHLSEPVLPFCGDGQVDPGEQCDDGNTVDGDGCDSNCTVTACGNGIVTPGEQCDDGNTVGGDGCSATCTLELVCGNGILEPGEQCDDGNTISGDGCSATCQIELRGECPLTQGFWKNHPDAWAVTSLTLGSQTYTQAELLTILKTSVGSGKTADASLILAHQLIAAKLNIANGSNPAPISSTIADADSLLSAFAGKLPYQVKPSSATGQQMVNDANLLDSYNNGALTPDCTP